MTAFEHSVTGIGLLSDPLRRELYRYVCAQPNAVSREVAAAEAGIPMHKAKFHLDKMESDGLLVAEYARVGGRTGPGAGRPSKLYRRADTEFAVSLPQRDYAWAGQLMADAIAESARSGEPVLQVLNSIAAAHGRRWGVEASFNPENADALEFAAHELAAKGYEPHRESDHMILSNCPFHALAQAHPEMVCGMNLALVDGFVDELRDRRLSCNLDPAEGRCCVTIVDTQPQT